MKRLMVAAVAAMAAGIAAAEPFTDGAVLQRGMKLPVWGSATAGATVKVAFAGQEKAATAGADEATGRLTLEAADGHERMVSF